jgi:hypothetical protein
MSVEKLLENWFDDYNQDCDISYLQAEYDYNPKGDPRHLKADKHQFYRNVRYGPYERNVLDLWQAESQSATPVVVYIHGGAFIGGSKNNVHRNPEAIDKYLAEGISVASINYRLKCKDKKIAVTIENPRGIGDGKPENGTRLDYILRDCARAVQFLRYKAKDWNINPELIAAYGGSAGGGASMWIGTMPDMKDEAAADPVLRHSTRIVAAGHWASQVTYNWPRWHKLLEMDSTFVYSNIGDDDIELMQMSREEMKSIKGKELGLILDYYENMTSDDCPFMTCSDQKYLTPEEITHRSQLVHHPYACDVLYRKGVSLGLQCEIFTKKRDEGTHHGSVAQFFIDIFKTLAK